MSRALVFPGQGSQAVGMGIREDSTLVTGKEARFVPHVILD